MSEAHTGSALMVCSWMVGEERTTSTHTSESPLSPAAAGKQGSSAAETPLRRIEESRECGT